MKILEDIPSTPSVPKTESSHYNKNLFNLSSSQQLCSNLRHSEWLGISLTAVVFPNLITCAKFTAFANFFRGWINIEILVLAALYVVVRSPVVLACIGFEFLLDLFEPVAHLYYFNANDAFEALRYLGMIPFWHLTLCTSLVVVYVVLLTAGTRFLIPQVRGHCMAGAAVILFLVAGVLFGFDCVSGRYQTMGADMTEFRASLVRTPALSAFYRASLLLRRRPADPPKAVKSAAAEFLDHASSSLIDSRVNLVLVVVESWGKITNTEAQNIVERAYHTPQLRARYTVETGAVPFNGPTLYGETRELCGQMFANGISQANAKNLQGCLPNVLAARGYSTVGIHGFYARMYDRRNWYPRVGFSTVLFKEDLDRLGVKDCPGGLIGTCDEDVAQLITNRLIQASSSHPLFVHWMTLNSHLPVPDKASAAEVQYCESASPVFRDRALCNWQTLVERAHQSVASIALTKLLPRTAFVVVGDHAPPFSSSRRRAEFSQTEVPYVFLIPKN